tara:strand:- start:172 stop:579 length:408 start_codon:yes stop_codon:yes gene_type:complete
MNEKKLENKEVAGISALLVHAARIDENYSDKEKKIISIFIKSFVKEDKETEKIFKEAENLERNSNQLLDFTNVVKKSSLEFKTRVIKELWKIIISNDVSDEYESNLMRRICGLIYFSDKLSGEIKMKLILERKKN